MDKLGIRRGRIWKNEKQERDELGRIRRAYLKIWGKVLEAEGRGEKS